MASKQDVRNEIEASGNEDEIYKQLDLLGL